MAKKKPRKRKTNRATLGKSRGPTAPTEQTVKRLFGLSSNQCAFPKCKNPMIDAQFGTVLGEICHIKGEKRTAPRQDPKQSNVQRHGFANLILLCRPHHKIIDDHWKEFRVPNLTKMKAEHEAAPAAVSEISDAQAKQFVANFLDSINRGPVVTSHRQQGGMTAGTIYNSGVINIAPPLPSGSDDIIVEGRLWVGGGQRAIKKYGTAGLCLDVVCKSKRPAKIRSASLVLEGTGFAAKAHQAFGAEFRDAVPNMPEQLTLAFFKNSRPTNAEGFVLKRDDVCHFLMPCWPEVLAEFLNGPADTLSVRIEFFDNSERVILQGELVQSTLRGFVESEVKKGRRATQTAKVSIRVCMTSLENTIQEGQLNQHGFSFTRGLHPTTQAKAWPLAAKLMVVRRGDHLSLVCMLKNMTENEYPEVIVEIAGGSPGKKAALDIAYFQPGASGPMKPGEERAFLLPLENVDKVRSFVRTLQLGRYELRVHDKEYAYSAIPSMGIKTVVERLEKSLNKTGDQKS